LNKQAIPKVSLN